jgi:hypothetical protein
MPKGQRDHWLTNAQLVTITTSLIRKYFLHRGTFVKPVTIGVKYAPRSMEMSLFYNRKTKSRSCAITRHYDDGTWEIWLHRCHRVVRQHTEISMLHELIHVAIKDFRHGSIFKKEVRRLMRLKAFDDLI